MWNDWTIYIMLMVVFFAFWIQHIIIVNLHSLSDASSSKTKKRLKIFICDNSHDRSSHGTRNLISQLRLLISKDNKHQHVIQFEEDAPFGANVEEETRNQIMNSTHAIIIFEKSIHDVQYSQWFHKKIEMVTTHAEHVYVVATRRHSFDDIQEYIHRNGATAEKPQDITVFYWKNITALAKEMVARSLGNGNNN